VFERSEVLGSEESRLELIKRIMRVLSKEFSSEVNVGVLSNKITGSISDLLSHSADYYEGLKLKSNRIAKNLLPASVNFIERGRTPKERFFRVCRLASVSNVAPLGVPSETYRFPEVSHLLGSRSPLPRVTEEVLRAAKQATHVLYLADNAGELGFDSLFIAKLREMGLRVTLIVKEGLFFEDATLKDAFFFRLDQSVEDVLTTQGFFVPSEGSPTQREAFKKSDLVISKGTGNYEALNGEAEGKNVIYMLKVKCKPIAMRMGAALGSFVVKLEN